MRRRPSQLHPRIESAAGWNILGFAPFGSWLCQHDLPLPDIANQSRFKSSVGKPWRWIHQRWCGTLARKIDLYHEWDADRAEGLIYCRLNEMLVICFAHAGADEQSWSPLKIVFYRQPLNMISLALTASTCQISFAVLFPAVLQFYQGSRMFTRLTFVAMHWSKRCLSFINNGGRISFRISTVFFFLLRAIAWTEPVEIRSMLLRRLNWIRYSFS